MGTGTFVTFPTLLALGFPPVTATMSNTIGLVAGSVTATWGYRHELHGQRRWLRWQLPASLIGAIVGAVLLLVLPEDAFVAVAPTLVVLALILVAVQTRLQRWARRRAVAAGHDASALPRRRLLLLVAGTLLVGIYGAYFAAAQGILLIGVMGIFLAQPIQQMNAAKNLLVLAVNTVSAVMFTVIAFDRVSWAAAGLIALGSLPGGLLGAALGRRLPPTALRGLIIALGLLALWRLLAA